MALKTTFCGKMLNMKMMRAIVKKKTNKMMVRSNVRVRILSKNHSFQRIL
jgi:hypothetical protein